MVIFYLLLSTAIAQSNDQDQDTDGDNMPDTWETEHGLDPNNSTDANKDNDGDEYSNYEEYLNNSDPNNPKDPKENVTVDGDSGKDEKDAMDLDSTPICILIIIPSIVILIVIIFVYTKMRREQLLEHKIRNDLFEYINAHPGVHYRGIMNDLGLHMGVLTHHLNMLEQQRYIKSYQDGMYRRFYPYNVKIETGMVLTDVQERILTGIKNTPGVSQTGIGKNLGLNRKLVHYHVKVLSDAGFVHVEPDGRETRCYYLDGLVDMGGDTEVMQGGSPAG